MALSDGDDTWLALDVKAPPRRQSPCRRRRGPRGRPLHEGHGRRQGAGGPAPGPRRDARPRFRRSGEARDRSQDSGPGRVRDERAPDAPHDSAVTSYDRVLPAARRSPSRRSSPSEPRPSHASAPPELASTSAPTSPAPPLRRGGASPSRSETPASTWRAAPRCSRRRRAARGARLVSLVVVPTGAKNAAVGIRVVAGITRDPEDCAANGYDGCIVSRRTLTYLPHQTQQVVMDLTSDCIGNVCDVNHTCVNGSCTDTVTATAPVAPDGGVCNPAPTVRCGDDGTRCPANDPTNACCVSFDFTTLTGKGSCMAPAACPSSSAVLYCDDSSDCAAGDAAIRSSAPRATMLPPGTTDYGGRASRAMRTPRAPPTPFARTVILPEIARQLHRRHLRAGLLPLRRLRPRRSRPAHLPG